jgi:hypothetical protein
LNWRHIRFAESTQAKSSERMLDSPPMRYLLPFVLLLTLIGTSAAQVKRVDDVVLKNAEKRVTVRSSKSTRQT